METRKTIRTSAISDADIAKLIEGLRAGYPIRDDKGTMIGLETKDKQERVMISDWEHKVLAKFKNARFRTPGREDPYLKFVDTAITLTRGGKILGIPGYWRRGVWIAKKLVTVTYRMAGDQLSAKSVPLGVEAVGRVEIRERRNSRTGEVNVIIDYYFYPSPTTTTYEVKIGGKKRKNTTFSHPIPETTEFVVVNKIGK